MGEHAKQTENIFLKFLKRIYISYIPNKRDNIKQIIIKVLFIVCLITLIVSASYIAKYFFEAKKHESISNYNREIWHATSSTGESEEDYTESFADKIKRLTAENSDFKGWITIDGTQVDNPIYQAADNDYYLNHNEQKKYSVYGALFFNCDNKITETETDKNLVIFGHEMKNGSMFGSLKKLKSLNFYKQHPTLEFSTLYKQSTYKIYSIFVLNAKKEDDNGYIYNIYRNSFYDEDDFNLWTSEAFDRSIIDTNVDVLYGDNIVTLVTCSNDFDNARLVVMAREVRSGEDDTVDTSSAVVNPDPIYPEKWYSDRGIKK